MASRDEGLGEGGRKCLVKASEQGERVNYERGFGIDRDEGTRNSIRVERLGATDSDRRGLTVVAGLRPDALVCRVLDRRAGVDPDVRERVFDPFSTTKAAGAETGLGLAISRRFAEEMDGGVEREEAVCELGGAACRLVLPIQGRSPERISKTAPREAEVREPNAIG